MVTSIALRRSLATGGPSLLNGLISCRPMMTCCLSVSPSVAPLGTRSFNTNTQMTRVDDRDDDIDIDRSSSNRSVSRRPEFPRLFSGVLDPFSPTRSVSQLMNLMDQLMETPFPTTPQASLRRGWEVKEDGSALYLRMDMPGLSKEDVEVSVEENTLIIKGEGEKEIEEEESRRRFSTRIDLTPNLYRIDAIRAEMKNGVLKVVVPKVKEEERKDVVHVNVE